MAASSIRWGRVVLGGFLAELLLIVAVIPLQATGSSQSAISALAVAGSFLAFALVAWWLCRSLARPILHGVLMGVAGAAIYTLVAVVGQLFVPDAPPIPLIYYFAHVLKLVGGATGGWLAKRRAIA
jgi:hypothetical protein